MHTSAPPPSPPKHTCMASCVYHMMPAIAIVIPRSLSRDITSCGCRQAVGEGQGASIPYKLSPLYLTPKVLSVTKSTPSHKSFEMLRPAGRQVEGVHEGRQLTLERVLREQADGGMCMKLAAGDSWHPWQEQADGGCA